jgi:hypothetical protein
VKFVISNAKLYDLIQKQIKMIMTTCQKWLWLLAQNDYDYLPKMIFNVLQCTLLPRKLWNAFRDWKPNKNIKQRFEDNTDNIKLQTTDNC